MKRLVIVAPTLLLFLTTACQSGDAKKEVVVETDSTEAVQPAAKPTVAEDPERKMLIRNWSVWQRQEVVEGSVKEMQPPPNSYMRVDASGGYVLKIGPNSQQGTWDFDRTTYEFRTTDMRGTINWYIEQLSEEELILKFPDQEVRLFFRAKATK